MRIQGIPDIRIMFFRAFENSYMIPLRIDKMLGVTVKNLILATLFLIVSAAGSFGQTPSPSPTPTPKPASSDEDVVKISTTLIQLDVTVTDKSGRIVRDLKPEDFEVYENGEKQPITNFSFISTAPDAKPSPTPKPDKNAAAIPIPPVKLRPEQVRRTIALVVDDLGLSFESIQSVRNALKKFVDEQMQPDDLVAIIRTGSGIGALQQFTSDKNMLYASIDKIRWNPLGRSGVSAFAPIEPTALEEAQAAGAEIPEEQVEADKQSAREFNQFREDLFSVGTLGAINFVVKGMGELPGRKSIMLFSDGFAICTPDNPDRCARVMESLRQLTDLCNRASVTIYTQDARGLAFTGITAADRVLNTPGAIQDALSSRSAELFDKQDGLAYLANETGGKAVFNNNNLNKGLEVLLEDTKGYYLIGYQPESDTFDAATRRFNKLTVKLNRKDLNVRYRSGFFGVADENIQRPAVETKTPYQQIMTAITSPFSTNGIDLTLNTLFGKDEKTGPYVHSFVHVKASDLKFTVAEDGTKSATFDVLAMNFGENGIVVDQINRNYTLRLKGETYDRIMKSGFVYNFQFPVKKPGAYQMRVAVRDSTSSMVGSANQFIDVPDLKKGRLTVSGIVLENMNEAQWQEAQVEPAARKQPRTDPMLDTSLRRFKRGSILRYGTEIYNAKLNKAKEANVSTQVRAFRDGKLILDGKMKPLAIQTPNGTKLNFMGALSLGVEMLPGDYVLQIVVVDNLAGNKRKLATQWIQFEVVD